MTSLPVGKQAVKTKDADKHVEPKAEDLRTRVQFPPPPPNTPHFSIAEGLKARIYRAFLRVQCRFKLAITLMAIDEETANIELRWES